MIELRGVSHWFGERQVLKSVSVDLSDRRIAVIGANGSGKSTFARLINGLQLPREGQVLVDGLDTKTDGKKVRRKVGFVFQNPDNQIVFPTVEEDLAFGMKNLGFAPDAISRSIDEVLSRYDMLGYRQHLTHNLSGGQKQLLAVAGVLVMQPAYIVLDEPTTLLDLRNKHRMAAAIAELQQTVILVTHDLDLICDFDRVIVFDQGEVVANERPAAAIGCYESLMA